jgi:diguanylate cyclase (GGDEF)-like protein
LSDRAWAKGELYHSICLAWIGVCVWLIGIQLDVFATLQMAVLTYGLADLVMLGCIMSLVLAVAAAVRSWELRRVIAAREEAQAQAQVLARHDVLTGLANRRVLREAIASGEGGPHALMLVDLDRFKPVNDVHGHPAGDLVLCEVSSRLTKLAQQRGVVARLGGDEFALFIPRRDHHEVMRTAQQIITTLSMPYDIGGIQVTIGATVGVALTPDDGTDASSLLRCADIALYRGKKEGRNTFRFFEAGMDDELKARAALEAELREAIANGEIRPHYQPLVSLETQELLGFEILSRWYHPTRGVLSPDSFIDIAEDTGLITDLSYGVLREACIDARSWPAHLRLALNISPYQLRDRALPQRLLAILTETGFSQAASRWRSPRRRLRRISKPLAVALTSLQNCGVKIALDDFRDRLFQPVSPARTPVRQDQDRPLVRPGLEPRPGQHEDRRRHHQPGKKPRPPHDRRGHRKHRQSRLAEGAGLHVRPGLPVRCADVRRSRSESCSRTSPHGRSLDWR